MTTIFEDSDNTNPPSPSLDILDASSLKHEIEPRKEPTSSAASAGVDINNAESMEELVEKFEKWKKGLEEKGLKVNTAKSKVMISSIAAKCDLVVGKWPCGVCRKGVGSNSIFCQTCKHWVHKKCSSISGRLRADIQFVCKRCKGTLYTVGSGGQIQQVITPSEASGLATVAVDGTPSDGSRYAYYPAVQTSDGNQGGPFYVMMSPQDVIPVTGNGGPRIIAPRAQNLTQLGDGTFAVESPADEPMTVQFRKVETTRSSRDERRRATHNEVERRRRDKINTWIMKIAAVIPDCQMDQSKQGTSKGGVLSKALDHIIKIRGDNDRLRETIKEQERILVENQVLRQQVEKLRQDNAILQANLQLRQTENLEEHESKTLESD